MTFKSKPYLNRPKGIKSNWLREMCDYAEKLIIPDPRGEFRSMSNVYKLLSEKSEHYLTRVPGIRIDKHQLHYSKVGADEMIEMLDAVNNKKVTIVLIPMP